MTVQPLFPGAGYVNPGTVVINRTVRAAGAGNIAAAATDIALTYREGHGFFIEDAGIGLYDGGDIFYEWSWNVSPGTTFLEVEFWLYPRNYTQSTPAVDGHFQVVVALKISDDAGHSAGALINGTPASTGTLPQVPLAWQGWNGTTGAPTATNAPPGSTAGKLEGALQGGSGSLSVDALVHAGLLGSNWTVQVVIDAANVEAPAGPDHTTPWIGRVQGREVCRLLADTADNAGGYVTIFGGALPGYQFLPQTPILADDGFGDLRLVHCLDVARQCNATLLALAWASGTPAWASCAGLPPTVATVATPTAFTNLEEGHGSGIAMPFRVPVKNLAPIASGSTEPAQFRVFYSTSGAGGAAVEMQAVSAPGGAGTTTTTATLSLAGTSGTLAWALWEPTTVPTDGGAQEAILQFYGVCTVGTLTLYGLVAMTDYP